jgi:hypothetical protein
MTSSFDKPDLGGEPSLKARFYATGLPNNKSSTTIGFNASIPVNTGLLPSLNYYGNSPGLCGITIMVSFTISPRQQLYESIFASMLFLPPLNIPTNSPFPKKIAAGSAGHAKSFSLKPLLINSNG